MANLRDPLGVLSDISRRDDAGLREILELTIRAALDDDESVELLGSESLNNALNALQRIPVESEPEPGKAPDSGPSTLPDWRVADGIAPRREAEPDELILGTPQYSDAVAELLCAAQGEVALALFGDWGIGKTTLAKAIADKLAKQQAPIRYEVVWFSAWQYRKPPETWIFLYETFVRYYLRRTLPVWERFARTLRVGAARHGVLNLVLLLSGLGLALLAASLSDWKASLGSAAVLAAAAPAVWTRAREPAKRLAARYAVLATHVDKLGMQATIGDDMRALLRAWQPQGVTAGTAAEQARAVWAAPLRDAVNPPGNESVQATFALPFVKLGALATGIIAIVWLAALLRVHDVLLGTASAVLLCLWATLCILCGLALLRQPVGLRRILLVVDDLDRCQTDEAMAIIEAVKLLLDDPEMQARVQVLMLADERTFALATVEKFKGLIDERATILQRDNPSLEKDAALATARSEVIREHREKLFLCHLRLGPLSPKEASDLGYRFSLPTPEPRDTEVPQKAGASDEGSPRPDGAGQERPLRAVGDGTAVKDTDPTAIYSTLDSGRQEQNATEIQAPMTTDEAVLLRDRLAALKASRQITPRNIRSLILRYQLARNLVRAGSGGTTPDRKTLEQILDTLVGSTFDGRAVAFGGDAVGRETVPYVIAQVS
jgi:hypothetical protein